MNPLTISRCNLDSVPPSLLQCRSHRCKVCWRNRLSCPATSLPWNETMSYSWCSGSGMATESRCTGNRIQSTNILPSPYIHHMTHSPALHLQLRRPHGRHGPSAVVVLAIRIRESRLLPGHHPSGTAPGGRPAADGRGCLSVPSGLSELSHAEPENKFHRYR